MVAQTRLAISFGALRHGCEQGGVEAVCLEDSSAIRIFMLVVPVGKKVLRLHYPP